MAYSYILEKKNANLKKQSKLHELSIQIGSGIDFDASQNASEKGYLPIAGINGQNRYRSQHSDPILNPGSILL
jgi:hypothetical protein